MADHATKSALSSQTPHQSKAQQPRQPKDERHVNPTPRTMSKLSMGGSGADVVGSVSGGRNGGPPSPRQKKTKASQYDRFIPNRAAMDMASSQFNIAR
ncbi:hypothetical protein LPJ75_006360, partial [Coemansia sp. RSA 2598]